MLHIIRISNSTSLQSFINRVEENENLKSSVTALKNTEAFKELEQYVAEFSTLKSTITQNHDH